MANIKISELPRKQLSEVPGGIIPVAHGSQTSGVLTDQFAKAQNLLLVSQEVTDVKQSLNTVAQNIESHAGDTGAHLGAGERSKWDAAAQQATDNAAALITIGPGTFAAVNQRITDETQAREEADDALDDKIADKAVESLSYNQATKTLTAATGDGTEIDAVLPEATSTMAGLMAGADVVALQNAIQDIQSLKLGGMWRATFATKADLEAAWPGLDVSDTVWTANDFVYVETDESRLDLAGKPQKTSYIVVDNGTARTLQFRGIENTPIAQATNTTLGVTKGTPIPDDPEDESADGKQYVENDGTMSTIGMDRIKGRVKTLEDVTLDNEPVQSSEKAVKSGGVWSWFGGTLSTLTTTAKTIIGAINELVAGKQSNIPASTNGHLATHSGTAGTFGAPVPPDTFATPSDIHNVNVPDYEAAESTNRISALNGSWTVDRDGFVFVGATILVASAGVMFTVNGKNAFTIGNWGPNTWGAVTLAVKRGDVVKLAVNYGSPTVKDVSCNFIPPAKIIAPWSAEMAFVPDYAKQETVNRISANGGSWTVDRDGFVLAGGTRTSNGAVVAVIVDGVTAAKLTPSGSEYETRTVLAVKKGQVVTVGTSGGFVTSYCYYIPPVALVPPTMGLTIQPHTWVPGVEINFGDGTFGKRVTGTANIPANDFASIPHFAPNEVTSMIAVGGTVCDNGYYVGGYDSDNFSSTAKRLNAGWGIKIRNHTATAQNNQAYDVWYRYTKV